MKVIISIICIVIYSILAFYFNNRKIKAYIKKLNNDKNNYIEKLKNKKGKKE